MIRGAVTLLIAASAEASPGIFHRVRDGNETYADIADHYYGKRHLERHLRMFNRRPEPLQQGTQIIIPTYQLVAVKRGQTLEEFAQFHLSDPSRAEYLASLHDLPKRERKYPKPGRRLRVVPSLKHVAQRGETLRSIASLYYREAPEKRIELLRLYNGLTGEGVRPGTAIRIPLDTQDFAHANVAKRAEQPFALAAAPPPASPAPPPPPPPPPARVTRSREPPRDDESPPDPNALAAPLEEADRLYAKGDYERCEKVARSALVAGGPAPSRVELLRLVAFSQIARGRYSDSKDTFRQLLALDPKYELDQYRTSPKILDIFEAVAIR
jgi:tetratricopeptide (TPR) repeat protein